MPLPPTFTPLRKATKVIDVEFDCNQNDAGARVDGNLWFTDDENGIIGKVTISGVFTEYTDTTHYSGLSQIMTGPDGNLWFTEGRHNAVAKLTPN